MGDVCPVSFVCMKMSVLPPLLHSACGNALHTPGSEAHPDCNMRDLQYWTQSIKMPDYRIWRECSGGSCTWTAPGLSWKSQLNGASKGKDGKGKGKGKGKSKMGKGGKGY